MQNNLSPATFRGFIPNKFPPTDTKTNISAFVLRNPLDICSFLLFSCSQIVNFYVPRQQMSRDDCVSFLLIWYN